MSIASLSIKRAIFISSIVLIIMSVGFLSLKKLGVDLFPNVEMPFMLITVAYPGASTTEMENLVSKPIEEEISSIAGLKKLTSENFEGVALIHVEFTLETDVKYAEQQMRDKVAKIRSKLPDDIQEPLFQRYDPSSMPVLRLALQADLPPAAIYDIAREIVKPKIEQIANIGYVSILGGTRREIQVELDRQKLNYYKLSALSIANQLSNGGANIPIGTDDRGKSVTVYRGIGQYETIDQIRNSLISFSGEASNGITLQSIAAVKDGTEDPKTLAYLYYPRKNEKGKRAADTAMRQALFIDVYKQSGTNTVAVVEDVLESIVGINDSLKGEKGNPSLLKVRDSSTVIRLNIEEVKFTIILGIILAVIVVYLFLGNIRSTIITGIAIPNSILGAFILMNIMGFTINVMTLMALSLTVGLLVDDAIVVRENIFRKLELNMRSFKAAIVGTREVMLAVIATTMTIIAVFFPIGFLQGMVGKFFKEFGFTVVFAMAISLFDALTVAPFLSAYFAGKPTKSKNIVVRAFDTFQGKIEKYYGRVMQYTLDHPLQAIAASLVVLLISFGFAATVKKTFFPESNQGEFVIALRMPSGTSLTGTREMTKKIEQKIIRSIPELAYMTVLIGNEQGESNVARLGIFLVPASERERTAIEIKTRARSLMKEFSYAQPMVNDPVLIGWENPFVLFLKGEDMDALEKYAKQVVQAVQGVPELTDVQSTAHEKMPEFHVSFDQQKMQQIGVVPRMAGAELRYQVAGYVVGKLHQDGLEYDIRMRLKPEQRSIASGFAQTRVPNMHGRLIPLQYAATGKLEKGSSILIREDRARVIRVYANLVSGGGIQNATEMVAAIIKKKLVPPKGITVEFSGQSEDFKDLSENIQLALMLSVIFIFFVLASLYESFITPFTILVALPPAFSGAFIGLFVAGDMLNMFSLIGIVMLLGLVTKNSILLVDFAVEGVRSGMSRKEAIYRAGMQRLRPILMTTFAMIAGTIPLALGIGEAANYRSAMGSAIVGGLVVSTLVTLIVVPAIFDYVDRFREFVEKRFRPKDIESQQEEVFSAESSL